MKPKTLFLFHKSKTVKHAMSSVLFQRKKNQRYIPELKKNLRHLFLNSLNVI
jgi:hypothetical protein